MKTTIILKTTLFISNSFREMTNLFQIIKMFITRISVEAQIYFK